MVYIPIFRFGSFYVHEIIQYFKDFHKKKKKKTVISDQITGTNLRLRILNYLV